VKLSMPARNETIGARLKRLRVERGLSQRELSSPGVSYAYISRIEAGARTPSVKALRMLARKLAVSVEYLETGRDASEAEERELRLTDAELALRLNSDADKVEAQLKKILGEARAGGDQPVAARARLALGLAAAQRDSHLEAVELLEAALADSEVDPVEQPDVYATLGHSYSALGAAERAVRLFERCLEEVTQAVPDDVHKQVRYATYLSYALSDAGDHGRAGQVIRDALVRAEIDPDPYTRIRLHWSMARLAGMQGHTREALRSIRRAIALLEMTEDTAYLARAHLMAAGVEITEQHREAAQPHVEVAAQLLGPAPEPLDLGMLRIVQARLALMAGHGERGLEYARAAIDTLGDQHGGEQGDAVWVLAQALALQGDQAGALDAYSRAVDLLSTHGRGAEAAAACREWAEALRSADRVDEAERAVKRATTLEANVTGATASLR
jgi:tetratricopeptide (TPR) repeat protein